MHPYPTNLRFRFPGSSAVSFFPLLRPLYYSLRTFSLAVFVHRFFFLFLRLFSSFSSLDIRFLHLQ
ncbi:CDG_1a_G0014040.mRNA.1.CDS.1 [Saccharomyces cerevisiae]|nr:BAI_1a_G0013880.mRNA.1.CDS.1 [Saccharomyces cerevisiae]CAI4414690.1 CDG_1a_G0014040.mRNA.1.CDS.1 [Saccharomyces cerevisiae]CAI7096241.1 BAI_1a_G0013880.mRNA.1.CDS.1 [Saccharomyces cerevisiae]CAI7251688.1 CDG_1a_G0014040.mRNA.1.CDS.1 [Saccharomyces cerevisiae]